MIHLNSIKCCITKETTLKGYGCVWFYEGNISNILSFVRIRQKHPARCDTKGNYFSIIKPDKAVLFRHILSGIYFHKICNLYLVLVNTVLEIREVFSQRQYYGYKQALAMVGYPSYKDFKNMVHSGIIPNCPVIVYYIKNYSTIIVPNIPSLKGKMVMRQPKNMVSNQINIPQYILQLHSMVLVATDIFLSTG